VKQLATPISGTEAHISGSTVSQASSKPDRVNRLSFLPRSVKVAVRNMVPDPHRPTHTVLSWTYRAASDFSQAPLFRFGLFNVTIMGRRAL
jgi:hypothetical protein